MYRTVITFKDGIPEDKLKELKATAEKCFDNRAGKTVDVSDCPNQMVFEGEWELYGCLNLGYLDLYEESGFVDYLDKWEWIDEEPGESCDLLIELALPVY